MNREIIVQIFARYLFEVACQTLKKNRVYALFFFFLLFWCLCELEFNLDFKFESLVKIKELFKVRAELSMSNGTRRFEEEQASYRYS